MGTDVNCPWRLCRMPSIYVSEFPSTLKSHIVPRKLTSTPIKGSFSVGFSQCRLLAGVLKGGGEWGRGVDCPYCFPIKSLMYSSINATAPFSCPPPSNYILQIPVNCSLHLYLQALRWECSPSFVGPRFCTM